MKVIMLLAALTALAMVTQGGLAVAQPAQDLLMQGNRASKERRYLEAEAAYRQALALDLKDADTYKKLGDVLVRQNKNVEAEAAYRQALALDPKDADTYKKLGDVLVRQNKNVEAVAAYRQAIGLDPKDVDTYRKLGHELMLQGKYVEAEAAYRQAIALDPKDAITYTSLGDVLQRQNKYVEAEAAYRQAIALIPKFVSAYTRLGDVLWRQNKNEEAEATYRQAIALDPMDAYTYRSLGNVLHEKEKYVEAEAAYRQAIALDSIGLLHASIYSSLGDLLSVQKKYVEAEAMYRKAIVFDPMDVFTYNSLGYLLQELGRLTDARDLYQKAIKLTPDSNLPRTNLEEVERLIGIASGTLKPLSPAEATRFLDSQDPLTPVRRSVVRIVPTFSGKSIGTGTHGTGFVVRRQGNKAWILTARHVIRSPEESREATKIQVELYGGKLPEGIVEARLQAQEAKSGEDDLALLVVVGLPEDIQPLSLASLPVKDGTPLTMVGHPRQEKWKNITGTLLTSNLNTLLVNSAQMAPGGSGSPVLSDKEEVIGMAYTTQVAGDIEQVVAYSFAKLQATLRQWGQ